MATLLHALKPLTISLGLMLLAGPYLAANIRAPRYQPLGACGALRPVPGLTLNGEQITFTFEGLYQGPNVNNEERPHSSRVEAVYRLHSRTDQIVRFDFISPSALAASARVNDRAAVVAVSPFVEPESKAPSDHRAVHKRYCLAFDGTLRAGSNVIVVTYLQPLGAAEFNVSYFTKSRWRTFAEYEFWPVKEWVRALDFRAEVILSVPRQGGLWEFLFGPRHQLTAGGSLRGSYSGFTIIPGAPQTAADRLVTKFILKGEELPDILTVSAAEK